MRRTVILLWCWLWSGLAVGGAPAPRDYLPQDSGTMLPSIEWNWWTFAVYAGPIIAACFLPRRWWFVMPIAFCWPLGFWLAVWMAR